MRAEMRRDFRWAILWMLPVGVVYLLLGLLAVTAVGFMLPSWLQSTVVILSAQIGCLVGFTWRYVWLRGSYSRRPVGAIDFSYWLVWPVLVLMGPVAWFVIGRSFMRPRAAYYLPPSRAEERRHAEQVRQAQAQQEES